MLRCEAPARSNLDAPSASMIKVEAVEVPAAQDLAVKDVDAQSLEDLVMYDADAHSSEELVMLNVDAHSVEVLVVKNVAASSGQKLSQDRLQTERPVTKCSCPSSSVSGVGADIRRNCPGEAGYEMQTFACG